MEASGVIPKKKILKLEHKSNFKNIKKAMPLLIMFLPAAIYFIVFHYIPMTGVLIAFQDYNLKDGIFGSNWVGLDNFKFLMNGKGISIVYNTIRLSLLNLVFTFPAPIILAIMLNEIRSTGLKKSVQTAVYLPHFLSWVIVGGMVATLFATNSGTVNQLIVKKLTGEGYPFLYNEFSWTIIYLFSAMWKEMGFSTIIYLSALSSIDPSLYEAVSIDGGGKFRQMWHITLPGLRPTIVILFILATGKIMNLGFDQVYVLQNSMVLDKTEIISTWIYKQGIKSGAYGITTALGLFNSVVNLILIVTTNKISKKFGENLW